MTRLFLLTAIYFLIIASGIVAQPVCRVTSYYEISDNEPLHHVCGILQDSNDMVWIASWGGMFSFDGTKFTVHDEQQTKSLGIAPGHSRGIEPCPTGDRWHLVGNPKECFHTDAFGTTWHITTSGQLLYRGGDGKEHVYSTVPPFEGYRGCFADKQGNWWVLCYYAIHKLEFSRQRLVPIPECEGKPLRCMYRFDDGSFWLCQRQNARVLVYASNGKLTGYLSKDGRIEKRPTDFHAPVYCIYSSKDGTIWLGTRGGGAYRLKPVIHGPAQGHQPVLDKQGGGKAFIVERIVSETNHSDDVYSICGDSRGRIWMATLNGGLSCVVRKSLQRPKAQKVAGYNYKEFPRCHSIAIRNDVLVVGTSEGLLVADVSVKDLPGVRFKVHRYHSNNNMGISSNLVDYVMFDNAGSLLVCTENGGLNICTSESLLDDKLHFEHIDNKNGLPDIAFAVAENRLDRLNKNGYGSSATSAQAYWVTSMYSISLVSRNEVNGQMETSRYGQDFFGGRFRFDEIAPLMLDRNRWIVSTDKGPMMLDTKGMTKKGFKPNIVVTLLRTGDTEIKYTKIPEQINLASDQRSFHIEFAALDYSNHGGINYYYRLNGSSKPWTPLGNSNTLSFADITPGKHTLEICSTNGQGQWTDNTINIVIDAEPRFGETIWALLLLIAVCMLCGWGVIYTITYVRRIKRKHNEMLAVYLSVIGKREETLATIQKDKEQDKDDAFIKKLMEYINRNLSDPNLRTEMIAEHMGVSLSTLSRMTKSQMGVTPGDFLYKARIRKAEIMLIEHRKLSVSEVAYRCGFNDPKYFSRCFKNEKKMSPTEYRNSTPHDSTGDK